MKRAPALRVTLDNQRPEAPGGAYVLYWMTAFRRTRFNFALEHALARAEELGRPLLVLEGLRAGYEHACDRFHRFVLDGMRENERRFSEAGVAYLPYVEPEPGAGRGLLEALGQRAALVVGDAWPGFFLPRMRAAAARRLTVRLESVDACGVLPLEDAPQPFATAYAFRRVVQKTFARHWDERPVADPLRRAAGRPLAVVPAAVTRRWPRASAALLAGEAQALARLPIDHAIAPVALAGGEAAGRAALRRFVAERLAGYGERNAVERAVTSGLSPYLHFGHVSAHEVVQAVLDHEGWTPQRLSPKANGRREGWWGVSPAAEGFLDQVVTWRELGLHGEAFGPPGTSYEALPAWARATLERHRADARQPAYDLAALEQAATHDDLWNAAQRQLRREGVIHNYLRMLWGKKVLEWTATPEEALRRLVLLNDRYAVDGRDPNSYTGIQWVLGRYDRPWGPQRPIFGSVRYMSSDSTRRKFDVTGYVQHFAPAAGEPGAGGAEAVGPGACAPAPVFPPAAGPLKRTRKAKQRNRRPAP